MKLEDVLINNYLPYAKGVIVGRAIPAIDGMKPSYRRVIYTMYKQGLLKGEKIKSATVTGATLALHPHGDAAVYDTMVRLTDGHGALNVPYIESKGNFGKVYSRSLVPAASRYTKVKLAPVCEELLSGLNENGTNMIPNDDNTAMEPELLPVRFPNILVNSSGGIAVGFGTEIPTFGLVEVCRATIGVMNGQIKECNKLADVIGVPEFTTGGTFHCSKEDLVKMLETGRGSFQVSGSATLYSNKIVITEIPYRANADNIVKDIVDFVKSGELKEVSRVSDTTDLSGFKIVVNVKNGHSPADVLNKLYRMTDLRMNVSFNTRVIIDGEASLLGVMELIQKWVKFRIETVRRIYEHRFNKANNKARLMAVWEYLDQNRDTIVDILRSNVNEKTTIARIRTAFPKMTPEQVEYLLDIKLRSMTSDNIIKKLEELAKVRAERDAYARVLNSDDEKRKVITEELKEIAEKYGRVRKTNQGEAIVKEVTKVERVIDDSYVIVILTRKGGIKRLDSIKTMGSYQLPEGEQEWTRWSCRNNDKLLVFTRSGIVHKVLVDDIDASSSGLKDSLVRMLSLSGVEDIIYVAPGEKMDTTLNIVYENMRVERVHFGRFSGKRSKYRSAYTPLEEGCGAVTTEDKFFVVTTNRKALYCDLSKDPMRRSVRVGRSNRNDKIHGVLPLKMVPDPSQIDLERYSKFYTVKIGEDKLW